MTLNKVKNNTFHRIGDRYANYIDSDHFLGRSAFDTFDDFKPQRNLKKSEDAFEIEVALPGFKKNEVEVTLIDDRLIVTAAKEGLENFKDGFLRQEFNTETQERSFALTPEIDQTSIDCHFSDGILYIKLPIKSNEHMENASRTIEIS